MTETNETDSAIFQQDPSPDSGLFTATEARIIACLMEKELAVADSYPLTLNSLVLACNQKSNREPQMKLSEGDVGHLAKALADQGMIQIEYGDRAHKFDHCMRKQLDIDKAQQALLAVMMLRAPQTLNDLKTRTARMAHFDDSDALLAALNALKDREPPLVQHLAKAAGQREDRYTHLLCGQVETAKPATNAPFIPAADSPSLEALTKRLDSLQRRIEQLEAAQAQS